MNEKTMKKSTFGTCAYAKTSPSQLTIPSAPKILNVIISFEDALKLNLGIDECIRHLNKYKKSTARGKKAALNISIHLDQERISVHEAQL